MESLPGYRTVFLPFISDAPTLTCTPQYNVALKTIDARIECTGEMNPPPTEGVWTFGPQGEVDILEENQGVITAGYEVLDGEILSESENNSSSWKKIQLIILSKSHKPFLFYAEKRFQNFASELLVILNKQ